MTTLIQRFKDWLLECRIKHYGRQVSRASRECDPVMAREYSNKMMAAIDKRSPEQWQRINQRTAERIAKGF